MTNPTATVVTAAFQLRAQTVFPDVSPAMSLPAQAFPCRASVALRTPLNPTQFPHFIKHLPACVYRSSEQSEEIQAKIPMLTGLFWLLAAARCFWCPVVQKTFTINIIEGILATGIIKKFIARTQ